MSNNTTTVFGCAIRLPDLPPAMESMAVRHALAALRVGRWLEMTAVNVKEHVMSTADWALGVLDQPEDSFEYEAHGAAAFEAILGNERAMVVAADLREDARVCLLESKRMTIGHNHAALQDGSLGMKTGYLAIRGSCNTRAVDTHSRMLQCLHAGIGVGCRSSSLWQLYMTRRVSETPTLLSTCAVKSVKPNPRCGSSAAPSWSTAAGRSMPRLTFRASTVPNRERAPVPCNAAYTSHSTSLI